MWPSIANCSSRNSLFLKTISYIEIHGITCLYGEKVQMTDNIENNLVRIIFNECIISGFNDSY